MKYLKISALTLFSVSYAKLSNILSFVDQLAQEKVGDADGPQGKTLASGWANSMVDSINGYGCWCYFENDHGKGKGHAQNDVDAQCRILHDGYSCIMMDADEQNIQEECVPWEVEYVEPMGLGWWAQTGDDQGMKDALAKDCQKKNKRAKNKWCAEKSCIVEGYFSINLFKLLTSGVKYNHNLLHSRGKFDPQLECPIIKGPVTVDRQCCGAYPVRFPFKHVPGQRECCGQNTYNAQFLQCCDDFSVSVVCM